MSARTTPADPAAAALPAPYSREFLTDPHPTLRWLRRHDPVSRVRVFGVTDAWLVTRHTDALRVVADPRFVMSLPDRPNPFGAPNDSGSPAGSLESSDPAEHARLRRLMMQGFTQRRVERLRERVAVILDDLLSEFARRDGEVELRSELARPFVVAVMATVFGIPDDGLGEFQERLINLGTGAGAPASDPELMRQKAASIRGVREKYLHGLVAAKRANPGDDVLSGLIVARDGDNRLTDTELTTAVSTLLLAGVITSTNLLVTGMRTLLDHPEQLARLRREPTLVRSAIEECLRYESPAISFYRMAAEDVRLGTADIARGDSVLVSLTSVNRDEQPFRDPDTFDLARSPNPHLAFGHGAHHCLGASVARLQAAAVFGAVFPRFPAMTACDTHPAWRSDGIVRGVADLRVRLRPGR